jgi:hypothetical protein
MDALFPLVMVEYLKPKVCTMFVLACGALVHMLESFANLVKIIQL